jgi:hypothetical protein
MTTLISDSLQLPAINQDPKGLGGYAAVTDSSTTLATILSNILGFLTVLGGIWFLTNFILAAVSWISAGGDKGKVQQAKDKLTNAVIGLALIVGAYAISGLLGSILGIDFLNLKGALGIITPK